MRRRSASPDAETMSHCPPPPFAIRLTISSDDCASCTLSLQPVCCSNDAVDGCVHVLSTYPGQSIRFSAPSPVPIESSGFMSAVGGFCSVGLLVVLEPQAVTAITTAAAQAASRGSLPDSSNRFISPSLLASVG